MQKTFRLCKTELRTWKLSHEESCIRTVAMPMKLEKVMTLRTYPVLPEWGSAAETGYGSP